VRHTAGIILRDDLFPSDGGGGGILPGGFVVPDTDAGGSWGLIGAGTKPLAVATNDGDTSYIESGAGSDLDQLFSFPDVPNIAARPDAGWSFEIVTRTVGGGILNGVDCRLLTAANFALLIFGDGPAGAAYTTSYQSFVMPLTAPQGAAVKAQMLAGTLFCGFRVGSGNANVVRITQVKLNYPAATLPLAAGAIINTPLFNVSGYTIFMLSLAFTGVLATIKFSVILHNPQDNTQESPQVGQSLATPGGNLVFGISPLPLGVAPTPAALAMAHYVHFRLENTSLIDAAISYGAIYCNTG
jgi:hypothetical protein